MYTYMCMVHVDMLLYTGTVFSCMCVDQLTWIFIHMYVKSTHGSTLSSAKTRTRHITLVLHSVPSHVCMYVCISTYAISPLRPPPAITNTYIHPTIHPPPQGFPAYLGTSRYPYINEDPQHKYIHHCGAVPIRAANIDTMSEREDRWIDRG